MDLGSEAGSPSSPARARASGWPSSALAAEGARSSPARAPSTRSTASTGSPRSRSTSPARRAGAARRRTRSSATGGVDVLVNNVGAVPAAPRRLPRDQRRGLRGVAPAQLLLRPARHARGRAARCSTRGGGAIVNVASVNAFFHPDGLRRRLRRGEGGAAQPRPRRWRRSSAPRASASTASLPARSRPTSGSATTASRRPSAGPRASTPPRSASRRPRACHRPLHHARRGGVARRAAGVAADGQRDGLDYAIDGGLVKTL